MSAPGSPPHVAATLRFFYCGRGDTILVEARDGGWGLIDCNLTRCSRAHQRVRKLVAEREISALEFVCLTHPDQDHYYGMKELLEECFRDHERQGLRPRFKQFWDSGVDLRAIQALAERMRRRGAAGKLTSLYQFLYPLFMRDAVERIALTDLGIAAEEFGDFSFIALAPRRNRVEQFTGYKYRQILQATEEWLQGAREESNNLSVVLVLMHRTQPLNILFGGDASAAVWAEALAAWERLLRLPRFHSRAPHFAGVKVSHHGARDSLHRELYRDYCLPDNTLAILSVGRDDRNHPHPDVLRVLKSHKIRTYATCWRNDTDSGMDATLPLPGDPVEGRSDGWPSLPGHGCTDVEVTVWSDGRLEATPPESLLQLG